MPGRSWHRSANGASGTDWESKATAAGSIHRPPSLVNTLGFCWRNPSLLALEVAWRWIFGAPAMLVLYWIGARIYSSSALAATGALDLSLADPLKASIALSETSRLLLPPLLAAATWLAPLLAIGWAAASGVGRNLVLRRYDRSLPFWPLTMIALQLLRVGALGGCFVAWLFMIRWAARVSLGSIATTPAVEPNLVLYFALVICFSLGIFSVWALLSWVFSVAPLIALAERQSITRAVTRSLRLGRLSGKLAEMNLVLGIVKLALIVLAMVFSATPLPFTNTMNGTALYLWWTGVTLLYLAASDFFQVARLIAFLNLLRWNERYTAA